MTSSEVKLRLEVAEGCIVVDNNVSQYVEFQRDADKLFICETSGAFTLDQMGAVLTYLRELEENLQ